MLLSFETLNEVSSASEGDSACVFFALALIKTDNGQMDWSDVKRLDACLSAISCSAPIKCIMHSVSPAGAVTGHWPSAASSQ